MQWKRIGSSVVLSCLCEAVGREKMFSSDLLSIVLSIKIVTRKSLRNKGDRFGTAMAGRLKSSYA